MLIFCQIEIDLSKKGFYVIYLHSIDKTSEHQVQILSSKKILNMKAVNLFTLLLSCIVLFSSCLTDGGEVVTVVYTPDQLQTLQKSLNLDDELVDYSIKLPTHIANQGANTSTIDNHKALLGRVLFYDNKLSKNEAVNCSSCHAQSKALPSLLTKL